MSPRPWVDPIEASARELLKKGMGRMPELRDLSPQQALEIVMQAERLATDEQDKALYDKATSARYVLPFAVLLLLGTMLAFVLYGSVSLALGKLGLGRRATGGLQIALAIGAFHLFIKLYRGRTARRMRPYVLRVLEKRKA